MTFTPISLSSLKRIKNTVIGNPSAKLKLAEDELLVQNLVRCLNDPPPTGPGVEDLRIEAAHVIASISYGSEQVLGTLLRSGAPQAFLFAISQLRSEDNVALRSAFARGLRALANAVADTVGPSQWGLREERSTIKDDAQVALDIIFQLESLDVYLPLLVDPSSSQTRISIAQLLAFAIRNAEHRTAVADWLPHEDRAREIKTKRGWEKAAANPNAPNRQGGWVCRNLTALAYSRDAKVQEAALWGLATIAKDNTTVAAVLGKPSLDREGPTFLQYVLKLAKSRSTDIQLAACLCATSIIRATASAHPTNSMVHVDDMSPRTVMNVINRIITAPNEPLPNRTKACFILYYLVTDHPALCFAAFERGCLAKLAAVLREITATTPPTEWDEEEPDSVAALREALLTAIAALSLFDNTIRRSVTDDLRLLPLIHAALAHKNKHVGVRYAACQCVRALSRAVAVLRTNIVDSGLGMAVFNIFKGLDADPNVKKGAEEVQEGDREEEDRRVTAAALAAVCNIVNEFSPLRPIYLDQGLMPRLVKLLQSEDATLRLSALWAVKNLLNKSSSETKRNVMHCLGWGKLMELFEEPDSAMQEQAWYLVRNLTENDSGVEMIAHQLDPPLFLAHLTRALGAPDDDVVLQASYSLGNLANGAQAHLIAAPALLGALRGVLAERGPHIRKPAMSAVLELARASTAGRRALLDAGIGGTLRRMCSAHSTAPYSPTHGHGHGHGSVSGSFHGRDSGHGVGSLGSMSGGTHGHGHGHGRGSAMDDDRDVIDQAKTALDWLEHGEAYR